MIDERLLASSTAPPDSARPRRVGSSSYVRDGGGAIYWRHYPALPEDWTSFTRLRLSIRPEPTALASYRLVMALVSGDAGGGTSDPLPFHFLPGLRAGVWNDVIWEFAELPRSKVTQLALLMPQVGPRGRFGRYQIRNLRLECAPVEHIAGWDIAPDRIACNHCGYDPDGQKIAFAAPRTDRFEVVEASSGKLVARLPAVLANSPSGPHAVLDFTSVTRPGRYRLIYSSAASAPFAVHIDATSMLIEPLLNFFYADRCGHAVAGAHGVCHSELIAEHEGRKRPANGGWHDAGNLCQGAYRTTVAVSSLLDAYEALSQLPGGVRRNRLAEEACWGMDWLLKTRFGRGVRVVNASFTIMQDGEKESGDEIVVSAQSAPFETMMFVSTALRFAHLFQRADPARAEASRLAALEDYAVAVTEIPANLSNLPEGANLPMPHELLAHAVEAALAVSATGGGAVAAAEAFAFARRLMELQEQRIGEAGSYLGYYNRDPDGRRRAIDIHTSFADASARAFAALCRAYPQHPDRAAWHAAVALESDCFLQRGAAHTAPFHHVPTAVWKRSDIDSYVARASARIPYAAAFGAPDVTPPDTPDGIRRTVLSELQAAMQLSEGEWLRTFPIAEDQVFHGSGTIQLARALSLDAASRLRGRKDLGALARRQLDWQLGVNPFCASVVYGVGEGYASLMQLWADDFVGAVPVGIASRGDAPYWPHTCHMTSREMWVVPAARMLALVAALREPVTASRTNLDVSGPGDQLSFVAQTSDTAARATRLIGHNLQIEAAADQAGPTSAWKARVMDPQRAWVAILLDLNGAVLADLVGPASKSARSAALEAV